MKRLHVHVKVDDLAQSTDFYNTLFGATPVKHKADYAKWLLDDPRVNFSISTGHAKPGLDHLGIQTDTEEELTELRQRMRQAELKTFAEGETTCCYAHSDKTWVQDLSGIAWETYRTLSDAEYFSDGSANNGQCCRPAGTPI
jgi:catechol 2,3-dioxygenase-like lactoylglutathione lyase family enzyme